MSSYILPRSTYVDLCAWLMYGHMPGTQWGGDQRPGCALLNRLKYTEKDILPAAVVGWHSDTMAEAITLGRSKRNGQQLPVEEAHGRAMAHTLYKANCQATGCRYNTKENADGWGDIIAGLSTVDPANVATWEGVDALQVLRCWDYQCSEDVAAADQARHTALMYAVQAFRLELAEEACRTGQRPRNVPASGGWAERISNATVDGRGPILLSALR